MQTAESLQQQKADKKEVLSAARQTMQYSEDSRALAVDRQAQERAALERQAVTDVEVGVAAALGAEAGQQQADMQAAAREAEMRAQAQRQEQVFVATEALTVAEAEQLRIDLLAQLGRVLEVRDTPRGLVVNMAETNFATGKSDLRVSAREKLAKLSGILAIHPGLLLEVEGYTDSTGSATLNQRLSVERAQNVAAFLVEQGVPRNTVTSRGFGAAHPIATNYTAAGRQQNRRVEIVISGSVIGRTIKTPAGRATDNN
jgi:outer membrane protein OmpA-like peptidoglycan-associated protein